MAMLECEFFCLKLTFPLLMYINIKNKCRRQKLHHGKRQEARNLQTLLNWRTRGEGHSSIQTTTRGRKRLDKSQRKKLKNETRNVKGRHSEKIGFCSLQRVQSFLPPSHPPINPVPYLFHVLWLGPFKRDLHLPLNHTPVQQVAYYETSRQGHFSIERNSFGISLGYNRTRTSFIFDALTF